MGPGTLMCRARTNRTLPANPVEMMVFHHNCHEKCLDHQRSKTRLRRGIGIESERRDWSFVAGFPVAELESFIIVRFHSQNHFFVNIDFPAKTERIIRFVDDQSTKGNQRRNWDAKTEPHAIAVEHVRRAVVPRKPSLPRTEQFLTSVMLYNGERRFIARVRWDRRRIGRHRAARYRIGLTIVGYGWQAALSGLETHLFRRLVLSCTVLNQRP